QRSVICFIPEETQCLDTGFSFSGSGKLWIDMQSLSTNSRTTALPRRPNDWLEDGMRNSLSPRRGRTFTRLLAKPRRLDRSTCIDWLEDGMRNSLSPGERENVRPSFGEAEAARSFDVYRL